MNKEDIKIKSRELVKKLLEKFDKLNWRRTNTSGVYALSFEGIASVHIDKQFLIVFNKDGSPIMENMPTAEEADAYYHVMLWSKIDSGYRKHADKHLDLLLKELESIL